MKKYIDADIFVTHCCNSCIKNGASCCPTVDSCDYIEDLQAFLADAPAADVAEVVRGEWDKTKYKEHDFRTYFCSVCGKREYYFNATQYAYCPHCGAHMMERSGSGE